MVVSSAADCLEAAKKGCLPCLKTMEESGDFLPLNSPKRAFAGEVWKLQVWDAAVAACTAGQTAVLKWILREGWPQVFDAVIPWDLRDSMDEWDADYYIREFANDLQMTLQGFWDVEGIVQHMVPGVTAPTLVEWNLYKAAMREPSLNCLAVLLDSGCRSPWICTTPALEGNGKALSIAVAQGCPCDIWAIFVATSTNNQQILQEIYKRLKKALAPLDSVWGPRYYATIRLSTYCAAKRGYLACLKTLLQESLPSDEWTRYGVSHALFLFALEGGSFLEAAGFVGNLTNLSAPALGYGGVCSTTIASI